MDLSERGRTGLSLGIAIRRILSSVGVPVFPVVSMAEVTLPYIVYCRQSMEDNDVKGFRGSRKYVVSLLCFSETYDGSLELAEAADAAMSAAAGEYDGIVLRGIVPADASEGYNGDAYYQELKYRILTN